MRWVVFILLVLGMLFCLSYFLPASTGNAGLFWPFATDTGVTLGFVNSISSSILAGVAEIFFLISIIGLFSDGISTVWWSVSVITATIASTLLYISYFGLGMILPILVSGTLLVGTVTNQWSAGVLRMRTLYGSVKELPLLLRIPVPWVFILAYLIGIGLQYLIPLPIHISGFVLISPIIGVVLIVAGVALAASCLRIFSKAQTTTVPFETASKLVTWGPYQFSRNPMYVGLTLIYLGEAGLLAQIWPLLLLFLVIVYVNYTVIPIEEARLKNAFGKSYEDYSKKVRRWL